MLWVRAYRDLVEQDESIRGGTFIGALEGNGTNDRLHKNKARNTIIFVPQSVDFEKPIDLVFYFMIKKDNLCLLNKWEI